MQFKTLAALALAGTALALPEPIEQRQAATTSSGNAAELASIYAILLTALPSSLAALAATNEPAAATVINSEINHSEAPWFTQLPAPAQSYLESLGEAQFGLTATVTGTASAGTISAGTTSSIGSNTTFSSPSLTPTTSSGSTSSAAAAATSKSSSGGASMPTAVIGAGVAGALGFIGMLAL